MGWLTRLAHFHFKENIMIGYLYPFYRSYVPAPYPIWGYSGYPIGNFGTNIVGSAIANNSLVNTGTAVGVIQTATPTVIG